MDSVKERMIADLKAVGIEVYGLKIGGGYIKEDGSFAVGFSNATTDDYYKNADKLPYIVVTDSRFNDWITGHYLTPDAIEKHIKELEKEKARIDKAIIKLSELKLKY